MVPTLFKCQFCGKWNHYLCSGGYWVTTTKAVQNWETNFHTLFLIPTFHLYAHQIKLDNGLCFFLFWMVKTKNGTTVYFPILVFSFDPAIRYMDQTPQVISVFGHSCTNQCVCYTGPFKGFSIWAWAELQTDNLYMKISSTVTELSQGLIQNIYIQNRYFCNAELKSFGLFFFPNIFA